MKVKKKYNLQAAQDDLKKRQDLYNAAQKKIDNLFKSINDNFTCMSITLPEDKKKNVDKEIKAVSGMQLVACCLRIVWPAPWTSRKTSPLSWRFSRPTQQLRRSSSLRVISHLRTPKTTRTS